MKKGFVILILLNSLFSCKNIAQTTEKSMEINIDTACFYNECYHDTSTIKRVLNNIQDPRKSRFIQDNFGNEHNSITKVFEHLKSILEKQQLEKVQAISGFFYEKDKFSFEDYICIQEWKCGSEKNATDVFLEIKRLKKLKIDDFVFLPHWIWIKSNDKIYLVDSTEQTESPSMIEAKRSLEIMIRVDSELLFN